MSHGGFPMEPWHGKGSQRNPLPPTSNSGPVDFSRSMAHPDDLPFLPATPGSLPQADRYGMMMQNPRHTPTQSYMATRPLSLNHPLPAAQEGYAPNVLSDPYQNFNQPAPHRLNTAPPQRAGPWMESGPVNYGPVGSRPISMSARSQSEREAIIRSSPDQYQWEDESPRSRTSGEYVGELPSNRGGTGLSRTQPKFHSQRRPSNRDEFDGPHQLLERPSAESTAAQERDLPILSTHLFVNEQDDILSQVNDRLSQCAFDFVAKYQFPIPLEPDKRPVTVPADREWTEWVYLLKRLATKRRIPARVLYNGQIKQLVTVLENSLEMRHAAKHQSRPLKDDRNVLQLISAGLQVARILKDASAMEFLDNLYIRTENAIQGRKASSGFSG